MVAPNELAPKTPEQIYELIEALVFMRNAPCQCSVIGTAHSFACVQGGRMMDAAIDALQWALSIRREGGRPDPLERLLADYRERHK